MKSSSISTSNAHIRIRQRLVLTILFSQLLLAFAACDASSPTVNNRGIEPRQEYDISGTVVAVEKSERRVRLAHDAIPGYMEAMTMGFALKDSSYLELLQPGDMLNAKLVVEGGRSFLEEIAFQRHTPMKPNAAGNAQSLDVPSEPTIGAQVPNFRLTDEDGKVFSFDELRGRALLLTFIYTRCPLPDYCPLMTTNFGEVARLLADKNLTSERTQLLSISFDPEHDTPAVLREYEARYVADRALRERIKFATGAPEEVRRVANYFGLLYKRGAGIDFDHSLRTALVAPDGKLLKIYRGNEWQPAAVAADISASLQDSQTSAAAAVAR